MACCGGRSLNFDAHTFPISVNLSTVEELFNRFPITSNTSSHLSLRLCNFDDLEDVCDEVEHGVGGKDTSVDSNSRVIDSAAGLVGS